MKYVLVFTTITSNPCRNQEKTERFMIIHTLREAFLNYFEKHGHTIVPSSPVVPHDDPTLLFCNAGMNQFKDVFLGAAQREYTRAATSQKCIRVGGKHNDLDNVGHTTRHMTFFEMLGNFSFGDYFKKEAIDFAWEVALSVFEFPKEKLWVSVYEEDDEAFELWKTHIDESRIARIGAKDNFWSMGDTGPCGPCSELFIDRGEGYGKARNPAEDEGGERFLEFWNLVFMQFNQSKEGRAPLKKQSIDTGAGLERVAMLKMGVDTVFATDILRTLIAEVENLSGKKYQPNDPLAPAFHVIADHLRALCFAIADGAQPSNVDRGYVLRKVLRRAVRYGRKLGFADPFLSRIVPKVVSEMGKPYPELSSAQTRIEELLFQEEESFLRTLRRGGNILQSIIDDSVHGSKKEISGHDAFKLKDTYGFPLEEILLIAKDNGLTVNLETYALLEEEAKEKSRKAHVSHVQEVSETMYKDFLEKHEETEFVGYDLYEVDASITGIVKDGAFVEHAAEGEEVLLLLDKTPFYAEKGGQLGDTGTLKNDSAHITVSNTISPYPGIIAHIGTIDKGTFILGGPVDAKIDIDRRVHIMRNHTATHLLHAALVEVLGDHIRQAGSLVEPDRLRFDFNHHKSVSLEELWEIERLVNERIMQNELVGTEEIEYAKAQKDTRIKQFFGDKYGAVVRVVSAGTFSHELCGGTHVGRTGEIMLFKIAKESSIAKGVRRIEAVTGHAAYDLVLTQEKALCSMAQTLNTPYNKLDSAFHHLIEEHAQLKQENKTLIDELLSQKASGLAQTAEQHGAYHLLAEEVAIDPKHLPTLANTIAEKLPQGALLLAARGDGKCQLLIRIAPSLIEKGIHANALIKEISHFIKGGGGGKKDAAQAGGQHAAGIPEALKTFKDIVKKSC